MLLWTGGNGPGTLIERHASPRQRKLFIAIFTSSIQRPVRLCTPASGRRVTKSLALRLDLEASLHPKVFQPSAAQAMSV